MFDSKIRMTWGAALIVALGTISFGPAPAFAASLPETPLVATVAADGPIAPIGSLPATTPTAPTVTLAGRLIQFADETGPAFAAVQTSDRQFVPVAASAVARFTSGSAITLEVLVPTRVRSVAAANGSLTVRGAGGQLTSTPLNTRDLASASDGTPEPATSDLGKATLVSASSTGQALAVSAVVSTTEPAGSYTPATRHLYVAIVTPSGWATPNAVTQAEIRTQVANASNYWSTVTSGGVTLDIATITAPYTSAYNCTNPMGLFNEAAARTGASRAANTSVVVVLPAGISKDSSSSCGYGLGTLSATVNDFGALYVTDKWFPALAHELGHNMSMKHADTLECPSASDSAFDGAGWTGAGCQQVSYGDGDDVMAASGPTFAPFLSSPQSWRSGLLPVSALSVLSAGGTQSVTLNALGSRSGVRAVAVVDPTSHVTYYVEYRVDSTPDKANIYGDALGVRVLRYNPQAGNAGQAGDTVLLDPTPSATPSTDRDATLKVGGTFTSYSGAVRVRTISTTSAAATVSITVGDTTPVSPAPPGVPTAVVASAGNDQSLVSWKAPASNGGSAITGYTVTANPGGSTVATTGATNATVDGLSNGTRYTFSVTATNAIGTSAASADSAGTTPMAPAEFTAQAPMRVLDTRSGVGAARAKLGAGATLTLTVPNLPVGATAVVLNVTATDPTAGSFLTVYPAGGSRPTASSLNFMARQTIPNMVLVPLGPGGAITFYNKAGTVNVVADFVGSYAPGAGAGFTAQAPTRVLDTRAGVGVAKAKLGAGQVLTLTVPGLPADATAVALNVTATDPTAGSFLTVYPAGGSRPMASSLNFVPGQTIPNMVLVALGPGGAVMFYNKSGSVNVVADFVGYYAPGTGALFTGQAPTRVLDTRSGEGAVRAKLGGGASLTITVPNLPAGATAVALNVTATDPTASSFLTVSPAGGSRPTASSLNFVPGQTIPNLAMVPVGAGGTVTIYNKAGTVNVVADFVGYYS